MRGLQLFLFGRFRLQCGGEPGLCLEGQKVQELLCYLLVHRDQFHSREKLAAMLWENSSESQAKQYLRRTLWQLQSAFNTETHPQSELILVDADWLQVNTEASFWCDVKQFEEAFYAAEGMRGNALDETIMRRLRAAAQLYQGELLESWYQDWCLVARERLQNMFLMMLDKLMSYCEVHSNYEEGIHFGDQILRFDNARERTYQRLMRLHYLAGDRTGALQRFQRCLVVLREELDLEPSRLTLSLYEQIKSDRPLSPAALVRQLEAQGSASSSLPELLKSLEDLQVSLARAQRQVTKEIERIRAALTSGPNSRNTP